MNSKYDRFLKGVKRIGNIYNNTNRPVKAFYLNAIRNKTYRYRGITTAFSLCYLGFLGFSMRTDEELIRVGAAGSITMLISESAFYCIDAVNARSKMLE